MNQQIKARWVEALRSGKYGQTSSYLYDSQGFCCLGVLCDLYNQEQKKKKKKTLPVIKINDLTEGKCYMYGKNTSYLPTVVKNWAGMKTRKGEFIHKDHYKFYNLAALNDGDYQHTKPKSFKQIAKIINDNVDLL